MNLLITLLAGFSVVSSAVLFAVYALFLKNITAGAFRSFYERDKSVRQLGLPVLAVSVSQHVLPV